MKILGTLARIAVAILVVVALVHFFLTQQQEEQEAKMSEHYLSSIGVPMKVECTNFGSHFSRYIAWYCRAEGENVHFQALQQTGLIPEATLGFVNETGARFMPVPEFPGGPINWDRFPGRVSNCERAFKSEGLQYQRFVPASDVIGEHLYFERVLFAESRNAVCLEFSAGW